ncbi:AraC family transcriptional regulator [Leucobacter celer]|uniref:AraC family transcriptional regulator n=1 Tax=Leucobacter celer TaxID=668625 RepID=UPI0006A7BB8E|nr:AraC family transcriptional regulator [Leucobacter celer]
MSETRVFRTTDVDHAIEIGSRAFYDHRLSPKRSRTPFAYSLIASPLGALTFGELHYGCEVSLTVGGQDQFYSVSAPDVGNLDLTTGRRTFTATPFAAAVSGPVDGVEITGWALGSERLTMVRFDRRTMEAQLARLLGAEATSEIRFLRLLDLRTVRGRQWWSLVTMMREAMKSPSGLVSNPYFVTQISDTLMTGLLLAAEHQYREALDSPPRRSSPAVVRRAQAFIEENVRQAITVPDIAAAVGASVRTLHRGFTEHLSVSPGAYLTRMRLEGAHHDLVRGTPETISVSDIATEWGFYNHGRFASSYRTRYGQLPSRTLRGR